MAWQGRGRIKACISHTACIEGASHVLLLYSYLWSCLVLWTPRIWFGDSGNVWWIHPAFLWCISQSYSQITRLWCTTEALFAFPLSESLVCCTRTRNLDATPTILWRGRGVAITYCDCVVVVNCYRNHFGTGYRSKSIALMQELLHIHVH